MGSSSSSLNKSPLRTDSMVTPESVPVILPQDKSDGVSTKVNMLQPSPSKQSFESPRRISTSISAVYSPANSNLTTVKSRWSFSSSKKSFGSKDETFFDSQQWLQSDSDDDFHSVNGDFTPSRGNTPKSSFSERTPRFVFQEKRPPRGISSLAPPQLRRKKLIELFRESIREKRPENSEKPSNLSTPHLPDPNSDEFATEDTIVKKKKNSYWKHHRCLPGLSSCGGTFMDRRKKMTSETKTMVVAVE